MKQSDLYITDMEARNGCQKFLKLPGQASTLRINLRPGMRDKQKIIIKNAKFFDRTGVYATTIPLCVTIHVVQRNTGSVVHHGNAGGIFAGLFGQIFETVGENITKSKEQRAQEKAFVRENEGSKAICAFFVNLFDKGNEGYNWVKKNRVGLYPVINSDSVSLCYMQAGDGQSLSGVKPKDIEVAQYSFQEMYSWYGLEAGVGYSSLNSRTQLNVLEHMISAEVQKLPHIKFNNGFLVKMFQ